MQTSIRARWLIRAAALVGTLAFAACPGDDAAPDDTVDTADAVEDTADAAEDTADARVDAADTARGPDVRPVDTAEAPRECVDPSDCAMCAFGPPPAEQADCVCPSCRRIATPREVCAANEAGWDAVCAGRDGAGERCEALECPELGRLACEADACVDTCAGVACPSLPCAVKEQVRAPGACCPACPGRCGDVAECVACRFGRDLDPDDACACPDCPTYASTATDCALRDAAFDALCGAWAIEKGCEVGACPDEPALTCVDDACAADGAKE